MAVEFGSNFITGITTATSDTDVAYKEYADNKPGYALTTTAVGGEFYKGNVSTGTTTVGFTTISVYDTSGSYNYPIDSSASSASMFITGSGGGGSESTSDSSVTTVGVNWGSVCSPLSEWSYSCMIFASNDSVIMGVSLNSRGIITSDNGISWTSRTLGASYAGCSLTYANNIFVYGSCEYAEISTSTDTINWSLRTFACGCGDIRGIAYGNGLWFAHNNCCGSAASTDAIHWSLRTLPLYQCTPGTRNTVAFGGGLFLAQGYRSTIASTDTIHWSLRTLPYDDMYAVNTKYIDNEFFIVNCASGTSCSGLMKSTDSIHWLNATCGNFVNSRQIQGSYKFVADIEKVAKNSRYFAVGDCSLVSTSTDFINWKSCRITDRKMWRTQSCNWDYCWWNISKSNLTAYPGRFIMGGYGYNSIAVSDIELSGAPGVGGAASSSFLYDISLENVSKKEGLTICVGARGKGGGKSWDSSNCSNWTARTAVPNSYKIFDLSYNNGKFVGVGLEKLVTTSTDAIHWQLRTIGNIPNVCNLQSVIYDYSNWLVVGNSSACNNNFGSLSASTDSIHWTQRTTGIPDDHSDIIYHDKKRTYVANSMGCSIASSTDAIHWKLRTIGSTNSSFVDFIGYGVDYYIAGGGQYFSSSTDAIHWKQRTVGNDGGTGNAASKFAFAYMHPNYVLSMGVSGNSGLISTSTDTINWTTRTGNSGMNHYVGTGTKMNSINGEIYRHNTSDCATYSTTDTIHWACKPLPTGGGFGYNFPAFAYGGGQFIRTYSCDNSGFCMSSFDASASSGCDTTVSWYDGFPANAKGNIYPLSVEASGVSAQWNIIMASNCKDSSSSCCFGCPGSTAWTTITESGTGANARTGVGDGEGIYSGFFNTTNITKVALVHDHDGSGSITPGSGGAWTRYVVYDLVESTGVESLYQILTRLNTYNKNNPNWAGSDGCFNANSASCFVSGNYTSGCLVHDSGHFKVSNCTSCAPDKFAIWGVNEDSDNDTQTLVAYYGCLASGNGKADAWRNLNPKQTFFSYWGNDWHSNSCNQTIGCAAQTHPGVVPNAAAASTGIDCSSIVYMLAYSSGSSSPPSSASSSYCFNPVGSGAAVLEYNSSNFRLSTSDTTAVDDFTVEFWYRLKTDGQNPTLQTLFALGEPTENGFLSVKHDASNSALCYYYKNTAGTLQSYALATSACDTWYHVALGYDASSKTFSHFLNGTRTGQYNASSSVPVVYGNRLRIGSLYDTNYSLTSLVDQGAFNGEISNFRISDNQRYTSGSYTVPTPDFTLDANTVFLTGRGESFNGSSGSQSCINVPGASGASSAAVGLGRDYDNFNLSLLSSLSTGYCCCGRRIFKGSSNLDFRDGLSSTISCNRNSPQTSTGGGAGAISNGDNAEGGKAYCIRYGVSSGYNSTNFGSGLGTGGNGGSAFVTPSVSEFSIRTGRSNDSTYGGAYLNNYYLINNCASTDTIHWQLRTVPSIYNNYSYSGYMISYNEVNSTEALMYASDCRLYHTTDTIHWKIRTTPFGCNGASSSCYVRSLKYMDNNEWSVSGCSLMSISTDTIHWFLRTAGGCCSNPDIKGIVYGNNKYMAAGNFYLASSTDSIAWTMRTRASCYFSSDSNPHTASFGNGMFVMTGYESVSYSTDAISWKGCCLSGNHYVYGMSFNRVINQFIGVSYYNKFLMSPDGVTWNNQWVGNTTYASTGRAGFNLNNKFFYSTSASCPSSCGLGRIMVADGLQGSFPGNDAGTGGGGGGGSYMSPVRESRPGGDGGDGYVRINWK